MRSVATKLHACVKSTIPACCSFCHTVAERLRQQWHDLASSPGPWDEARLSLSFNWMQTSLLAPSYNTITSSSVTQTGRIRKHNITIHLNAQKMLYCLLEIKTVAANKGDKSALTSYALQVLSKAFWYDQNTEWSPTTVVSFLEHNYKL